VRSGHGADRIGVREGRGGTQIEALEQLVDQRAAHAQVERGRRGVGDLVASAASRRCSGGSCSRSPSPRSMVEAVRHWA
jgi:hypothetical protein